VVCSEWAKYERSNIYRCPGYRLPTEAEWEYGYRAGTTTAYYSGKNDPKACNMSYCTQDANLDPIAWYCFNRKYASHPVGLKQPNAWGLFDMAGNRLKLTNDWLGPYQVPGPAAVVDPGGQSAGQAHAKARVVRGGVAWPSNMRAAFRGAGTVYSKDSGYTFRCARTLKP
jgi:formylglycine-generating enzyme required for sulfatase activity